MLRYLPVRRVYARQVLDSRGNPTVEAEVTIGEGIMGINGYTARAMVPSGASTGRFEAVELRDGDKDKYLGLSVEKAVNNVNTKLAEAILGENALDQMNIDRLLIEADGQQKTRAAQVLMLSSVFLWLWQGQRQRLLGYLFISILEDVIQNRCRSP